MLFSLPEKNLTASVEPGDNRPALAQVDMTITDAFGKLEAGKEYPFCSGALWSTHDLIAWCLRQIGPASLTACTWSMAEHAATKLIALLEAGSLTSVAMLVDWRVQVRTPAAMPLARLHFSDIRVTTCHAKVWILRNEQWSISVVGSANFTNNPRIEAGHLSTLPAIASFHEEWIKAEIANSKPFGVDMRKARQDGRK